MPSASMTLDTATPGADANTYNLFDSTTDIGAGLMRVRGLSRLTFGVENSQAGTLKAYRSTDRGTSWDQVGGDIAVAAAPATDISGPYDYLVDTYKDFKLDWVNGGAAQATWRPEITLIFHDRASGA
jgi:hypothetical protein